MTHALGTVLLVDDEPAILKAVGQVLEQAGYSVLREGSGEMAIETYERAHPDVVVLDLNLPGISGLETLEHLAPQNAAVILLTGYGDVPTAVRAMQLGAENFLTKPVDMPHLVATVGQTVEKVRLRRELQHLRSRLEAPSLEGSLGVSAEMAELERNAALVAESDRTTVLLTGESGTGKGRLAQLIHQASPRAKAPFVPINCGGLSASLLDNELFGHEKGAFTDARDAKEGLFEVANQGTLFLDEIGTLALELQPKLLGVLETKRFRRLGGTHEIAVNVRLVTATNADLQEAVEQGLVREDFYYRVSVTVLRLPPVRERSREDRRHLIQRVMAELSQEFPGAPTDLTSDALDRLLKYRWPGNVREMRNAMEHAMIMARDADVIGARHLPAEIRQGGERARRQQGTLREAERRQIERILRSYEGNRTHAARELGISRVTLLKKIKEYGLEV